MHSSSGFTLVEIIVSMAILAIVVAFIGSSYIAGVSIFNKSSQKALGGMGAAARLQEAINSTPSGGAVATSSGSFQINYGGSQVAVGGVYMGAADSNGTVYRTFVPQ